MILEEAIKEIKSRVKPYNHVGMSQPTFSNTIRNIEAGTAKWPTIEAFMNKFGYKIERSDIWKIK